MMAAFFLLAIVPRLWALGWGLPSVEHPDEPALVEVVVRMLQHHDPNPHTFLYPSLFYYLLAAVTRLYSWWGLAHGLRTAVNDLPLKTYQWTADSGLYVWDRAVTACLGALTVPALYMLGRRMFDRRSGWLAATALAVSTFHVEHSHYITTDVPTGLWVVLCLIGAVGIVTDGRWQGYVLAGVAAGLAAGTKYNAGTVAIALPLAHVLHWGRRSVGRPALALLAAGVVTGTAFLLTTPWVLLDWPHFVGGLRFNAAHYAAGVHGDFVGRWEVGMYVAFLWSSALLPAACLLTLSSVALLRRYPRQLVLLLGVVAAGWLPLLAQSVNFVRNLLPIFPLLLLLAAAAASALAGQMRGVYVSRIMLACLIGAIVLPPAIKTAQMLQYWSRPYTMVAAASTLRSLPRGMLAAVEMNPLAWVNDPVVFPVTRLTDHPLSWYRANGFRYLLVNSDDARNDDPAALAKLMQAGTAVVRYPERRLGRQPGPGGVLLDLGEDQEALAMIRQPAQWGTSIRLLGYREAGGEPRSRSTPLVEMKRVVLVPAQGLQIDLFLRALVPLTHDYSLFVHVIDGKGRTVARRDLPLRDADYPTSHWRTGELVLDRADLPLPPLPHGRYAVQIGLYDGVSGAQLPLTSGGVVGGGSVSLGELEVK